MMKLKKECTVLSIWAVYRGENWYLFYLNNAKSAKDIIRMAHRRSLPALGVLTFSFGALSGLAVCYH